MIRNLFPTPYPELNQVLFKLSASIHETLADKFTGLYLQGSFAVGDFDEHSDVDFLVVIRDEISEAEVSALQILHKKIYALPSAWAQHLEGSYYPLHVLRDFSAVDNNMWYLDNGSDHLELSTHCNSLLVRQILHEQGVIIRGPEPRLLLGPVPLSNLRTEMLSVIKNWGNEILSAPDKYNNRFYQGFIVLSFCRMPHDYQTGIPGSKRAGAAWAKETFDPKWRDLIDRAWLCRPIPEVSVRTPADPTDFAATLDFVRYVLKQVVC